MIELKKLKKGSYVLYKDEPHEVAEVGIVVTGTHSHSKCKATVRNIFTSASETFTRSLHETIEELNIIRKKAQVLSKVNNKMQIMDPVSYETLDAEIDQNLFNEISEGDEITYIEHNNRIKIIEKR
ncbi:MAG: hypothetical protein V1740_05120 [Candidatus Woesearchaeota archaeon]